MNREATWRHPVRDGVMRSAVGAFDWVRTPLGPIESWPRSLKTAVDICLASPEPLALVWGTARTLVYNDAYIPIVQDRHPGVLGESWADAWPDAARTADDLLDAVLAGDGAGVADLQLALRGFSCSITPLAGDDGRIAGALVRAVESPVNAARAVDTFDDSEALYRALFESIDQGLCVLERTTSASGKLDFRYTATNPAFERQSGLSNAVGRTIRELVEDPDERLMRLYLQVIETGEPVRFEGRVEALDLWIDSYNFAMGPADRRRCAVLFTNVSTRKRSESALAASEERYRLAARAVDGVVYDWDVASGRVERSDGLNNVIGVAPDDLPRHAGAWSDRVHPDDAEAASNILAAAIGKGDKHFEHQYRVRHEDGRWVDVVDRGVLIYDNDGKPSRIVGSTVDISSQKRAEIALKNSEAKLSEVLEHLPIGVGLFDTNGKYQLTNPALGMAVGSYVPSFDPNVPSPCEAVDSSGAVLGREDQPAARALRGEIVPLSVDIEVPVEGDVRWLRVGAAPLWENGKVVAGVAVTQDVTEQKRAEDSLKAALERQRVLVAELQHRTRNLLGIVRSIAAQTMRRSASLDDFEARFSDRLATLSRAQGLLSGPQPEAIGIGALIKMEIDAICDDDARGRILVDGEDIALPVDVVQVLTLAIHELLTNAQKHGALLADEGRLSIRWRIDDAESGRPLHLDWRERGVALGGGTAPPTSGYGWQLIERALPYQFGARTSFSINEDGIGCSITLPLRPKADGVAA